MLKIIKSIRPRRFYRQLTSTVGGASVVFASVATTYPLFASAAFLFVALAAMAAAFVFAVLVR
jgi:hypothetical protein